MPIRLKELMSKRDGNCNVMITGPVDHELYVIFLATAMIFSLYRLIIATTSSLLYRLGSTSALALSRTEFLRVACESKQFALMSAHKDYLLTNAFLDIARPVFWDVDICFYQAVLAVKLHCNVLW